ncbi:MAG: hypothetical protein ACT4QC_03865 [Planctomycetaceae bacterium]
MPRFCSLFSRTTAAGLVVVCAVAAGVCAAREFVEPVAGEHPSWRLVNSGPAMRVADQRRLAGAGRAGGAAEQIEVDSRAAVATLHFERPLPPALLIDDLVLSLWLRSEQDGAKLAMRVVFPHQADRTGQPLSRLLEADRYTKTGQWQKLVCRDVRAQLERGLPALRRQLQVEGRAAAEVDLSGVYVDAAVILAPTGPGRARFLIDELTFGPIVDATPQQMIQQIAAQEAEPESAARFHGNRLHVQKRPFLPRIAPWQGEPPEDLARMRLNTIWVPDYTDTGLLGRLAEAGLWSMAEPPAVAHDPASASLAPLSRPDTDPILFWYLGTRIRAQSKSDLTAWVDQIHSVDRSHRPIMGDVAGLERSYSRQLDMLGVNRPTLFTSFNLKSYRDWLDQRRNLAWPGSYFWTWVSTEPLPSMADQRAAAHWSPVVMEPEQLQLQVFAALAAGCRGIAYWTNTPLDAEGPGLRERRLALTQVNLFLDLLEDLLATGTVSSQEPFSATLPPTGKPGALATPAGRSRDSEELASQLNNRETQLQNRRQVKSNLEAVVINTEQGVLVLLIWYSDDGQYVPGQLAANEARIVVPGVGEAARAYEISTTEITPLLDSKRVTGGVEVVLPKFDACSCTAILFTHDDRAFNRLKPKVQALAEPSAQITLELAREKLDRTVDVDFHLRQYRRGQRDADWIIARARTKLRDAELALQNRDFHRSRMHSGDALQLLRILQHAHWTNATRDRYSPVSSPHTVCFQTLPDHWEMLARVGRASSAEPKNLLRSGDCEDYDTLVGEGWRREEVDIPGVRPLAELNPQAHSGKYCLRLTAGPAAGQDPPTVVTDRPVTVTSPPLTVYKGQIVYITGWVKMVTASVGSLDGAMLYDSIGGPALALRWRGVTGWERFELIRPISETTDMTLTMTLTGMGDIRFDDLQVIAIDVSSADSPGEKPPANRPQRGKTFENFLKLPRLPGFGGRQEPE